MNRSKARYQQLVKAQAFLQRALAAPEGEIQRAASIQAFEFCFELSWKYLKSLVEEDGRLVSSPKAAFREAAQLGYIDNPEDWFEFLTARNLTVHTYIESIADDIYKVIKNSFAPGLEKLLESTES